jgi:hypothetical protein
MDEAVLLASRLKKALIVYPLFHSFSPSHSYPHVEENCSKGFQRATQLDVAELGINFLDSAQLSMFFVNHFLDFLEGKAPRL